MRPFTKQSLRATGNAVRTDPRKQRKLQELAERFRAVFVDEMYSGMLSVDTVVMSSNKDPRIRLAQLNLDLDNANKAIFDALKGVIIVDDKNIVRQLSYKLYGPCDLIVARVAQLLPLERETV